VKETASGRKAQYSAHCALPQMCVGAPVGGSGVEESGWEMGRGIGGL
jgi:hypothetical protein